MICQQQYSVCGFHDHLTCDHRYMIGTCLAEQLQALQIFLSASSGYLAYSSLQYGILALFYKTLRV